jgi:signal transduction histidine kinase
MPGFRTLSRRVAPASIPLLVGGCTALIFGGFALAALMLMRLDRADRQNQAAASAARQAEALAGIAAANLDRLAAEGAAYAADPGNLPTDPALGNIAVFGKDGALLALLHRRNIPSRPPAAKGPVLSAAAGGDSLSFALPDRMVVVTFDPAALAPPVLFKGVRLVGAGGVLLAGGKGAAAAATDLPGWPARAEILSGENAAPAWNGRLPLYLFLLLGLPLAGFWIGALLTMLFVREQKAAQTLRRLKASRPEAKWMVRLAEAERAAAESVRSKSEFIAHMSHELRTPLNAVIGFSEVISQGLFGPPGHPKYVEYADDIASAGRNLHAKIGDILEFANIEAGRYPLAPEILDLSDLASACVEEQKGRAFSRQIDLSLVQSEPGLVRADPRALRRVFHNLLANALAYTAEGGWVRLDVRSEEDTLLLTVTDSGRGFSGEEQKKAGQPFQRFDRPGTVTGAGLGLAIAMELTRRMGGAMRLGSTGAGSVMELRFLKFQH